MAAMTACGCASLPPTAFAATPQALRCEDFIDAEGVVTHLNYSDGTYARLGVVLSDLAYLGIDHVRDGVNAPGQAGSAGIDAYEHVAAAGIKFTLGVSGGNFSLTEGTPLSPSLRQRMANIDQLARAVPGSVVAVEGANEINNWPIVYDGKGRSGAGLDELNATLAMQRALYAAVHADPILRGVPVDYFTGYGAGTIPNGPDPATTPGLADNDTQHPYPNNGQPPAFWVSRKQALGNETAEDAAAGAAAVYTETGYTSNGGHTGGVNQDVQAKYTLDLFLDTARNGISATYLYELLDAYVPGSRQGDAGYGLFDFTGAAKPVAVALHNLNILFRDAAPSANSFATTPLGYDVIGETATGAHLVFEKSNGVHIIALWDETPIWDPALAREIPISPHSVRVVIQGVPHLSMTVFDPMLGPSPIATIAGPVASVAISDHPVFLRVEATGD